jgi:hypothetical protein
MCTPEAQASGSREWILRRKPLDQEMWSAFRGMELEGALAALTRLQAYWACLPS